MPKATHGMSKTPIYRIWVAMVARCVNPRATSYHKYGALGVTVCERWRSFENFYADMGDRPDGDGWSIDRIDGTKGYEPGNCRWATSSEQNRNRPRFRGDRRSPQGRAAMGLPPLPVKTHCHNGHEFTSANTMIRKHDGVKICRTCSRANAAKYRQSLREGRVRQAAREQNLTELSFQRFLRPDLMDDGELG